MLSLIKKIHKILTPQERVQTYILFGMMLVSGVLDTIGIASIFPFVSILSNPESIDNNPYLRKSFDFSGMESKESFQFMLGVAVFLIMQVSIAFKAFTTYSVLRFTSKLNAEISARLVRLFVEQPYDWFLDQHSATIGQNILSEVNVVVSQAILSLARLCSGITSSGLVITLLFIVNPTVSAVAAAILTTAYLLVYAAMRSKLFRLGKIRVASNELKYRAVNETFAGIKQIKVSGLEAIFIGRFKKPATVNARVQASAAFAAQLPRFFLEGLAFGGMIVLVLFLMATKGDLQNALPSIALFAVAGYRLLPTVQLIYQCMAIIRSSEAAVDNIYGEFRQFAGNRRQNIHDSDSTKQEFELKHALSLKAVSYYYPNCSTRAVKDLNLNIPAGAMVGFVGETGSGKTTTIDIILGLLRPTSGELIIDGRLVSDDNLRHWQRRIAYVPQDIFLTDDSIADNIAFGIPREQIDFDSVRNSARIASLDTFVTEKLPEKYETKIGEQGTRLSGGQRQRIGIARALYRTPDLLVFDEATSALDNMTEKNVISALHSLPHKTTVIFIAHRLSTVKECDIIFLMKDGTTAEQGTYAELLNTSADFRALAKANN